MTYTSALNKPVRGAEWKKFPIQIEDTKPEALEINLVYLLLSS